MPTLVLIKCPICKLDHSIAVGYVNQANKKGVPLYCGRKCAGVARQKTKEEKVALKAKYDKEYRKNNFDKIKQRNRSYNESPAGRAMQKRNREKFKQHHLEYCRTPQYRKKKHEYDQQYKAKKVYGELWESYLLIKQLNKEIDDKEVRQINDLHNKTQKRKKQWQQLKQDKNCLQKT